MLSKASAYQPALGRLMVGRIVHQNSRPVRDSSTRNGPSPTCSESRCRCTMDSWAGAYSLPRAGWLAIRLAQSVKPARSGRTPGLELCPYPGVWTRIPGTAENDISTFAPSSYSGAEPKGRRGRYLMALLGGVGPLVSVQTRTVRIPKRPYSNTCLHLCRRKGPHIRR